MKILFILLGFVATVNANANESLLMEIRDRLPIVFEDASECERLYQKAITVNAPSPILQGYIGAIYLAKSRHSSIFKKLSFFNQGTETLEAALKRAPNELELRFLRLTIQLNIPSFLGYNEEIASDKQFVLSKCKSAPPTLRQRIVNFVQESDEFTSEEKRMAS